MKSGWKPTGPSPSEDLYKFHGLVEVLHRQGIPVIRLPSDLRARNMRRREAKARIGVIAGFDWHQRELDH